MPHRTSHSALPLFIALLVALIPLRSVAFVVRVAPDTYYSPLPGQYAPGASVTLVAIPYGDEELTSLQWSHNDVPIPGATGSQLIIPSATAVDSGNYTLSALVDGRSRSSTVTINVLPFPPSPVDISFSSDLPAGALSARVEALLPDGRIIARGEFFGSGQNLFSRFFRLRSDGTREAEITLPAGTHVLTGWGSDALITDTPPFRVGFDGTPHSLSLPAGFDAAKDLSVATVQTDGKLLIAQGARIARLQSDGAIDPSFNYTVLPGKTIRSLRPDSSGRIYVTTSEAASADNPSVTKWTVFRLSADGTVDATFAHQSTLFSDTFIVAPLDDGRVVRYSANEGSGQWQMLRDDGTADPGWASASVFAYLAPVIDAARAHVYQRDARDVIRRYVIGATGLNQDHSFFPGFESGVWLQVDANGKLLVGGGFITWDGHPTHFLARLRTDIVAVVPPVVHISDDGPPAMGAHVSLTAQVTGTGPMTYEWLPLDHQPITSARNEANLSLSPFRAEWLGRYQVKVTGPGGSVFSHIITLAVDETTRPYLANLSGRARTGRDEDTIIAGLVVRRNPANWPGIKALVRGVGPALADLGVHEAIANPAVDVFSSASVIVANNDQWSVNADEIRNAANAVGAFALKADSYDAALLHIFPNGTSTMMLKDQGQGDGVGLLEVYQVDPPHADAELLNLSFRARTASGDRVAIAGFVTIDPAGLKRPMRMLLRAVGPTLSSKGVAHALANPVLNVFNAEGKKIASNDDWATDNSSGDAATLAAAMKQVGAFELAADSKDSALLLDLPAGAYTLHAIGGEGVVLLEIYVVR